MEIDNKIAARVNNAVMPAWFKKARAARLTAANVLEEVATWGTEAKAQTVTGFLEVLDLLPGAEGDRLFQFVLGAVSENLKKNVEREWTRLRPVMSGAATTAGDSVKADEIDTDIASLGNPPDIAALEKLLVRIARAKVSETKRGLWAVAVAKQTGALKSDLNRDLKALREKRETVTDATNPQSDALVNMLSGEIDQDYLMPPLDHSEFHLAAMDGGVIWICRPMENGVGEAYCTPFVVQGEAHFEDGSRAIRLRVRSEPGQWKDVDIKVAWLAQPSGTEAIAALQNAGFKYRPSGREYILEYLSSVELPAIKIVGRPGWDDDGETFVLPTGGVIPATSKIELSRKVQSKAAAQGGLFEVYQNNVDWVFRHPRGAHFQIGFLIADAGCLSGLLDDDTLAFFFYGPSSMGKSQSETCSVSMFGDGRLSKGLFVTARTTENAAEYPVMMASGSVTAYDEVKHMAPNALQDLIFMIESGMGKGRMYRDQEIRKSLKWRGGAVILSDELSLGQRLSLGNVKIAAGLAARIASISFHDSYEFPQTEFARIKSFEKNFGWGGPLFVEALHRLGYVTDPEELRVRMNEFAGRLADGVTKDHAMRLRAAEIPAYIWLAAEVNKEAGLVPADYDAEKMARWVWKNMLDSDIAPESASAKGLATLRSALMRRKNFDVVDYTDNERKFREAVAYHNASHKDHKDKKFFVIPTSKLAELSGGSATQKAMLDELEQEQILVRDGKGARTWDYFPGLGKVQYVVLAAEGVEGVEAPIGAAMPVALEMSAVRATSDGPEVPPVSRHRF